MEHLAQPFLALAVGRFGTHIGEDIAVCHLISVEIAEETLAQPFVGAIAYRATEAGNVESLAGGDKGDGNVASVVADGTETGVGVARKYHVGMYLVRYHIDVVAVADIGNACKGVAVPHRATWVVWVAKD